MSQVITGNPDFDRQVNGPAGDGKKLRVEGGSEQTPFEAGLFQNVTDVGWISGQFAYAGLNQAGATPFAQGGWSGDGQNWFGEAFAQDSAMLVCIRGKSQSGEATILAGGFRSPQFSGAQPQLFASFDDAKSWQDAGLPIQSVGPNSIGSIIAVGYDPKGKQFLATALYSSRDPVSGAVTYVPTIYAGLPDSWDVVYQASLTAGQFITNGFSNAAYPKNTRMCDSAGVTFIFSVIPNSVRSDLKYASAFVKGQVVKDGKTTVSVDANTGQFTLNGAVTSVPGIDGVVCATAGGGIIAVAGQLLPLSSPQRGPVIKISHDGGQSWETVLPDLTRDNGNTGAVSFS